jgi:acyl-CoA synthetase (AMP-forming)/AMP-acid ligase II
MVPLTHGNLCASACNIARNLDLSETDTCLNVMPLFHIHGLVACVLAPLAAGGGTTCPRAFDAGQFPGWLEAWKPTWYSAVPTMHQAILAHLQGQSRTFAGSTLRFIRSSSAALPPSVMEDLEKTFRVPVIESYGMTEAAHQIASNPLPPRLRKPGSVGLPAGPEVAILDEAGGFVEAGAAGEIAIRGANVTLGYHGNSEANAQAFHRGWLRTGDQGYLDPDGYLFISGRLKEQINRGGEKLSPREIDEGRGICRAPPFAGRGLGRRRCLACRNGLHGGGIEGICLGSTACVQDTEPDCPSDGHPARADG